MTAASMAKGPVGVVVPVLGAVVTGVVWRGRRGVSYVALGVSVAVALAVTVGWVLLAAQEAGDAFRDRMLFRQTAGRVANALAHAKPWYFYLQVSPSHLLPWVAFIPGTIAYLRRARRDDAFADPDHAARGALGLLAFAAVGFVFFSVVSGKRPGYVLPLFPALALVVAWSVAYAEEAVLSVASRRWVAWPIHATARLLTGVGIALAIAFVFAGPIVSALPDQSALELRGVVDEFPAWTPFVGIVVGLAVALLGTRARKECDRCRMIAASMTCVVAIAFVMTATHAVILPSINTGRSVRPFVEHVRETVPPGDEVVLLGRHYEGRVNLYTGVERYRVVMRDELRAVAAAHPATLWVVARESELDKVPPADLAAFEVVYGRRVGKRGYVLIRERSDD